MTFIGETLFADYSKERNGCEILEDEFGFVIYRLIGKEEVFIEEMFVRRDKRQEGHGRHLIQQLTAIAAECKIMTGNIWVRKPGASGVLLGALLVGFEVISAQDDCLLIGKKLRGV